MSTTDIGPNDIIIHLVNPFKCMDCGTEFFHRSSFLQHLSEHMDKLKKQHPCYQIVCGVNLAAQQPNSITVTKDILQINENQIFELQDSSVDYTQLPPLKMLEQAGILHLPTPKKANPISLLKFLNNTPPVNITLPSSQSLLPPRIPPGSNSLIQGQGSAHLNSTIGFLEHAPEDKHLSEANIDLTNIHDLQNSGTTNDELQALVQQAFLENEGIKDDLSNSQTATFSDSDSVLTKNDSPGQFTIIPSIGVTKGPETWVSIETPQQSQLQQRHQQQQALPGVKHVMLFKDIPDPPLSQVNDKRVECKICLNRFASKNVLMRHQVIHSGDKPHSCPKCFKQFYDISSLSKHIKIHKRSHQCPVCLKMFLHRRQMELHLAQHKKKCFIQFGHKYHEVHVATSRNESGQIVREFSLSVLLKKKNDNNGNNVHKENQHQVSTSTESLVLSENPVTDTNPSVEGGGSSSTSTNEAMILPNQPKEQLTEKSIHLPHNVDEFDGTGTANTGNIENSGSAAKVVYRCGHCKKYINTRPTLSRHLMLHTSERPFRCEQCGKQFRQKTDLVHHYKTHSKPAKCITCGSAFSKQVYLQNHLQKGCPFSESDLDKFTLLPDETYQCNLCRKVLKSKANVVRHLRIHAFNSEESDSKKINRGMHGKGDSIDNITDIKSDNLDDYIKPLDTSVGFVCSLCGVEFRYRSYIIIHVRMHLGLRPFKCKECGKGFPGRHMLRKHQVKHTRPYKCPECGKGFYRRYLMAHHFNKSHSEDAEERMKDMTYLPEEKMLQCDICGKTMKSHQKSLMQSHIRLHKDVRPHQCNVCDKTFISNIALKKHALNHSKPYVCQVCNKGYSRRYLMLDHFNKHCKHKMKSQERGCESEEMMDNNEPLARDTEQNQIIILKAGETEGEGSNPTEYQAEIITEVDEAKGVEFFKCAPCDKTFKVKDALSRHIKTFRKSTACKYCKTSFEDKHLTLAHQRSCLGTDVSDQIKTSKKRASTKVHNIGEKQGKVLKTMKEMNSLIDNLTVQSTIPTNSKISPQTDQEQCDQDLEDVLSFLNSENINSGTESSITKSAANRDNNDSIEAITNRTKSILKGDDKSSSYQCPNCPKSFDTPRGLKIHASSHVRLYKCDKCGEDFTQVSKLRHHLKSHDNDYGELDKETNNDGEIDNDTTKTSESFSSSDDQSENSQKRKKLSMDSANNDTSPTLHTLKLGHTYAGKDEKPVEEHKLNSPMDIGLVSARLMQTGTRGRPHSCTMCRKRFTEQEVLHQHMSSAHGVFV